MSGKNKTLIFVTSVLILFSVAILAVLKIQQEDEIAIFKEKKLKDVQTSYENISRKYEAYYIDMVANYFYSADIKEIIRNRNKNLLYNYTIKKYAILQKQNINLVSMKFYSPDNTLLLNMDDKDASSAKVGSLAVKKVHKLQKQTFTAEQEGSLVLFKSIQPIFYGQEYLGAIEFGINMNYIPKDMKLFANISGAMFTLKNNTTSFELLYKNIDNMAIVDKVSKKHEFKVVESIQTRKGITYAVYTFYVEDYRGINIAKFHFFNNVTTETASFKEHLNQIATFLLAMILISIIIINSGVRISLKNIQNSFDNLAEYTDMIDNNIMMLDTSVDGLITGLSKRFSSISGYSQDELVGKSLDVLKAEGEDIKLYEQMNKTLSKDKLWIGEFKNYTKDNKPYWLSVVASAKMKDDKVFCYNFIMHNITDKKQKEEMVYIDELTSTYNRKYFNDVFPRMVQNIKRNGGCVNLIILDVDDFKKYNELYGTKKGDEALVKIANRLKESLRRPDDYCFRLGGGEFALLYRSKDENEGYLYAQVLKKNIEMLGIEHKENHKYKVLTISLGVVSRKQNLIDEEQEIYTLAYEHLQRAKSDGRNKVIRALI